METIHRFEGRLVLVSEGEGDDLLGLEVNGQSQRLVSLILEHMEQFGRFLSVRYFTSPTQKSFGKMEEQFVRQLVGESFGDDEARYSEITGYLWTNDELEVGGHDLTNELTSHIGEWLAMEIQFSQTAN